jgi:hypothetical protein
MRHEKDNNGPVMHGNLLSIILKRALHKGGESEVIKVAKKVVSGLTDDQVVAIAKGSASLIGNSLDGFDYKE